MPNAHASEETLHGVEGVVFRTDAKEGSAEEAALQAIQSDLADGVVSLPADTTLPHLRMASARQVGGPTITTIEFWVPKPLNYRAEARLEEAGFTVS